MVNKQDRTGDEMDRGRARVLEVLRPGSAVRQYFGPDHIFNERLYIRGVVDGEWIVWRTWSKSRRSWTYQVDWYYKFWLLLRDGNLLTLSGAVIPLEVE